MTPNLLWHSNAPHAPTGYGAQTALFAPRLRDHLPEFAISAFYGVEGAPIRWDGIVVYPGLGATYGDQTILEHARVQFGGDLRAGMVVTLMDVWVLSPHIWRGVNAACWVPVDHEPVPPAVASFLRAADAVPIAMSRFGERMLRDAGLDPLYVPHAVDCAAYRPLDKIESRRSRGLPEDAFIVGMVAANKGNPSRKCFHEAFEAFKHLRDQHPEALLYVHAEATGAISGVDLPALMRDVGLEPAAARFPDQYRVMHAPFSPHEMAEFYSSMDVLLAASAGEGFGIPVVEAQACGVPVIVSDFSAQPELVGAGWLVEGQRKYTPAQAFQFSPSIPDVHDALRRAYAASLDGQREAMSGRARVFAEQYDVRHVFEEFMVPALEEAWARFEARRPLKVAA